MPIVLAGRDAQSKAAFAKLQALYESHRLGVDATVTLASAWAQAKFADLSTTKRRIVGVLRAVAGLCIAIALALFFTVGRRISNMLGAEPAELHREVLRLAKGDLAPSKRSAAYMGHCKWRKKAYKPNSIKPNAPTKTCKKPCMNSTT
jgi:hypothetical protein